MRALLAAAAMLSVATLPAPALAADAAHEPASCEGFAPLVTGCEVGHLYDGWDYGFEFPACPSPLAPQPVGVPGAACFVGTLEMDFIGDAWGAYFVRCTAVALAAVPAQLACTETGTFPVLNSYRVACRASPLPGPAGTEVGPLGAFRCWADGLVLG